LNRWATAIGLITLALFVFMPWQPRKLPGLMNNLPVYPGAELESLMTLDLPAGATAQLQVEAQPDAVQAFYRERMINDGRSVVLERPAFLALSKDDLFMMIDIMESPDGKIRIIMTTAGTLRV
jgi:hypothetical protein